MLRRLEGVGADGRQAFDDDLDRQDATLRRLQTLSESAQRLSAELKERHPSVRYEPLVCFIRATMTYLTTAVELGVIWASSATAMGLLTTWIRADRTPRWTYRYRGGPAVDERLFVAIAILTDAILSSLAVTSQSASGTVWMSIGIFVGAQALLVGGWLWRVSRRHEARVWRHIHRP